jgi:excisionase family DNA binding protein
MQRGSSKEMLFEKYWTVTETAHYLAVSEKTIRDWVHKKKIPFRKLHRLVRFAPNEIEKWLSDQGGHYGN